MKSILRVSASILLGLLALVLVGWGGVVLYASRKDAVSRRLFHERVGGREELARRFPPHAENAAAAAVASRALALGLDVRGGRGAGPGRGAREAIGAWLHANVRSEEGRPTPLPDVASAYLSGHAETLSALEADLKDGVPRWEDRFVENGALARLPHLSAIVDLHRIELARAALLEARGDAAGAAAALSAAARVRQSLGVRAELVAYVLAISMGRHEAALVRKLPSAGADALARLADPAPKEGLRWALLSEGVVVELGPSLPEAPEPDEPTAAGERLLGWALGPSFEKLANSSTRLASVAALDVLEGAGCRFSTDEAKRAIDLAARTALPKAFEGWAPNLADPIRRYLRFEQERELAAAVQDARAGRAGGSVASRVCKEGSWVVARGAGSGFTVAWHGPPVAENGKPSAEPALAHREP